MKKQNKFKNQQKKTDFKIEQFSKLYKSLMKNAPKDYAPWFFPCEKEGKNPGALAIMKNAPEKTMCCGSNWVKRQTKKDQKAESKTKPQWRCDSCEKTKGSWHGLHARLSKEQVIEHIKLGYNIGFSAREGDAVIIGDIDEAEYMNQMPKNTLTQTSRKRCGGHFIGWDKDGSAKINLPTDFGELRSNNQYVLCCGSYVPFNLENERDKKAFDNLPKEAREDEYLGYYTIRDEVEPKEMSFDDLPAFFKQEKRMNDVSDNEVTQREEKRAYEDTGGKYSELFKLKMSDILDEACCDKRTGHPLHESTTDANFCLSNDGNIGHCWRHLVSLNPVQYLCVKAGYSKCKDAGTPHKEYDKDGKPIIRFSKIKGDKKALEVAYQEALKLGLISEYKGDVVDNYEEKMVVMDYKSLMNYKIVKQPYLIDNILPEGEVVILAGKRGDGKTWIAMEEGLGVCSGTDVFGEKVKEKKKVMFIDEEGGEGNMANRMQLLAKGKDLENDDLDFISLSFSGLKLDQPMSKKFKEFEELLDRHRPNLVIIDCLQRVVSIDIDKENAQISEMFTGIMRPFIKKYGMTFLLIHHLRKSPTGNQGNSSDPLDEIRGGSEITNYARCVQSCSQPKNQKKQDDGSMMLVFKILKMSNAPMIEPKVLNFQPNNADPELSTQIKIDYLGKVEDVLKAEKQAANAIMEYLLENQMTGEFTTKEITDNEAKIGFKRTWLGKGLKELVDEGKLERLKRGIYILSDKKEVVKPKPTLKPKLPYGSPKKSIEEQKKDLVKTDDDINDETIEESLRVKKVEELKDNPFCPKCNSPTIKDGDKFVCFDTDCGGVAE